MRVWLYCRSTRGSESVIEKQATQLLKFADQHGLEIVGISQDGYDSNNYFLKGLNVIIDNAARGRIDAVLVTELSAISNYRDTIECFHKKISQDGVKIYVLKKLDERLISASTQFVEWAVILPKKEKPAQQAVTKKEPLLG